MRIGVVGLGIIWQTVHMPILDEMPEHFTITAVCTRSEENLAPWRQKYPSASAYTDYEKLVRDENIDAVLVATPINLNAPVAAAALAAGKHVFLENPISTSYPSAVELCDMEAKSGKTIYLLEQFAYHPQIPVIRDIIETKKIGRLVAYERAAHFSIDNAGAYAHSEWRRKGDFPIGLLLENGVHDIALLTSVFGLPHTVYSLGTKLRPGMGEYDYVLSVFSYKNDIRGVFSHSGHLCNKNYFIIRGTEGAVYAESDKVIIESKAGDCQEISIPMPDIYEEMWKHFAEITANGHPPLITAGDATQMMKIIGAVGRSIENETAEKI